MKLVEAFMGEGAADADSRQLAREICDVISRRLFFAGPDRSNDARSGSPATAIYNLSKSGREDPRLAPYFRRLVLWIRGDRRIGMGGAGAEYFNDDGWDHIIIHEPNHNNGRNWGEYVSENAREIWGLARAKAFHEVIHLIDSKRYQLPQHIGKGRKYDDRILGPDNGTVEMGKQLTAYYDDPLEFNAHTQETFNEFERDLDRNKVKDRAGLKRVMMGVGENPQAFVQWMFRRLKTDHQKNISPEFKQKFYKRAVQFWNDLQTRFP